MLAPASTGSGCRNAPAPVNLTPLAGLERASASPPGRRATVARGALADTERRIDACIAERIPARASGRPLPRDPSASGHAVAPAGGALLRPTGFCEAPPPLQGLGTACPLQPPTTREPNRTSPLPRRPSASYSRTARCSWHPGRPRRTAPRHLLYAPEAQLTRAGADGHVSRGGVFDGGEPPRFDQGDRPGRAAIFTAGPPVRLPNHRDGASAAPATDARRRGGREHTHHRRLLAPQASVAGCALSVCDDIRRL